MSTWFWDDPFLNFNNLYKRASYPKLRNTVLCNSSVKLETDEKINEIPKNCQKTTSIEDLLDYLLFYSTFVRIFGNTRSEFHTLSQNGGGDWWLFAAKFFICNNLFWANFLGEFSKKNARSEVGARGGGQKGQEGQRPSIAPSPVITYAELHFG